MRKYLANFKGLYMVRSKGRTYYYLRSRGTTVVRLPDIQDPTFVSAYARAIQNKPHKENVKPFTVQWLVIKYLASPEFLKLSDKSQDSYKREITRLEPIFDMHVSKVSRQTIRLLRAKLESKPRTQQLFTQVASVVFGFAIKELDLQVINPAEGFKRVEKGESYRRWSEEEMRTFENSNPPPELKTAYLICRYAGVRRGDLVRLSRNDWDGVSLSVAGHKTKTPVVIPAHARLREHLNSLPPTLTLVADVKGRAVSAMSLSKRLKYYANKIHLSDLHLHGLRHEAANALSEAGCTPSEIQAVLGHRTLQMVEKYTAQRDQRALAARAIAKLEKGKQ